LPPWLLHHGAIKLVWSLLCNLQLPAQSPTVPLPPSLPVEKKKRIEKQIWKNKRGLLSLRGVVLLSLLFHGGVEVAYIRGYARAPVKPRNSGVYDSDRVCYLSYARGSCISCSGGGDTSWHSWCSMSEDSMCHHINFFTPCYGPTTWSYIT
jgi:hypothetical protein